MKGITAFLFLLLFAGMTVQAQTLKNRSKTHQQRLWAVKNLNLDAAQKGQLKSIQQDYQTKLTALEKNDGITVKQYREQKQALHKELQTKRQAVLTAEQKQKIANARKMQAIRQQKQQQERLEWMQFKLKLTDAQMADIKKRREATRIQVQKLKEDQKLTPIEKREKVLALRKQNKEAFESTLTPTQKATLEGMKKEGRTRRGVNRV